MTGQMVTRLAACIEGWMQAEKGILSVCKDIRSPELSVVTKLIRSLANAVLRAPLNWLFSHLISTLHS